MPAVRRDDAVRRAAGPHKGYETEREERVIARGSCQHQGHAGAGGTVTLLGMALG